MIRINDRYFVRGRKGKGEIPDRTYTVLEVRSKWDIRCLVDPPLNGNKDKTMVSFPFLEKAEKL